MVKNLAVKKDINGNSVLVRVVKRRKQRAYTPVVPIERLCDTIAMHHRDSVGFRGEKKLWNFVSCLGKPAGSLGYSRGSPVLCAVVCPTGLLPQVHPLRLLSGAALNPQDPLTP